LPFSWIPSLFCQILGSIHFLSLQIP
jgi:hypothetical protein